MTGHKLTLPALMAAARAFAETAAKAVGSATRRAPGERNPKQVALLHAGKIYIPRKVYAARESNARRSAWLNDPSRKRSPADIDAMLAAQTKRERRRLKCASDFAAMCAGNANWRAMEATR